VGAEGLSFICTGCGYAVLLDDQAYVCPHCARRFPVVCGIPDFRLRDDPYISIEGDRAKALRIGERLSNRSFADLVAYYYSITDDVPSDLVERWSAHALAAVEIARTVIDGASLLDTPAPGGLLLDVGCATGGLLVAASARWRVVGVDIALRWMVVGQARLREAGVNAQFVCASADRLPFREGTFNAVTALDLVEHLTDSADAACREMHRVSAAESVTILTANNRYAPVPEAQLGVWGVGYVPRRWQAAYVAWWRPDVNPYKIALRSAPELRRLLINAGYRDIETTAAPLCAPHVGGPLLQRSLRLYNATRTWPIISSILGRIGPKLQATARRTSPHTL
jgi:ubiquinone/menaquinone biosynthesis C-methylase UbiE